MEVELFLSLLFIIIIIDMKNLTKREMESIYTNISGVDK